jgi:pilus assembly protein FimV
MGTINNIVGMVSGWVLASTTNMAITGAGVLLLILLPFYIRSKRSQGDQTLGEMTAEEVSYEEPEDFTADLDDDLLAEVEDDFEEVISDEPETLDAVVEAEMYMAYQKYDQAEEKLKEAFADHPDRSDVGLKLLEVYAETGDVNAFGELESKLTLDAEQQRLASDLRAKLPIGGMADAGELESDMMSDDLNLDLDVGGDELDFSATSSESSDLDLDLDMGLEATSEPASDDLDFSLESETDSVVSLENEVSPAVEEEADLDFSLDLGDLDETTGAEADTDLDFSLDGLDDDSLDLDLDSGLDEPEIAESSTSDLDFSLELEDEGADEISLDLDADTETDESLDLDVELVESSDSVLELDSDGGLELDTSAEDDFSLDTELSLDDDVMSELDDVSLEVGDVDLTDEVADLSSFDSASLESEPSEEISSGDTEIDFDASNDALEQLASSLDSDAELEEDEFDFLSGSDEASTKLDLARAYIEMDDKDGARDILEEVASEGSDEQVSQAKELMAQL